MNKLTHCLRRVLGALCVLLLSSCADTREDCCELYFVGDSIIELWHTYSFFPSYRTHNQGVSGSKLADLESRPFPPSDSIVVCQIGTNDLQFDFMTDADRSSYVSHYLSVVSQLSRNRVYLFCVLPSIVDHRDRNIPWFNDSIRARIKEYPNVTYLDVYDQFLDADGKSLKKQLTRDDLHLNDDGYRILTDVLLQKLLE